MRMAKGLPAVCYTQSVQLIKVINEKWGELSCPSCPGFGGPDMYVLQDIDVKLCNSAQFDNSCMEENKCTCTSCYIMTN